PSKDIIAFSKLVSERKKRIEKASSEPISSDPINDLARNLHPERLNLVIDQIRNETKSTKTYKLVVDTQSTTKELAYFQPGQYLSLKVDVNGILITRPYSIASSPKEALDGYYEITIKREDHGFLTQYIWENWKVGTKVISSGPEGFFYYEPLRDSKQIVGIAGGSGITPFRSIAKAIVSGLIDAKLIVFYGSSDQEDIIYFNEFKELEKQNEDKIKIIHVLSCEEVTLEGCEVGFITAGIIQKHCDVSDASFFICGPQPMYNFVEKELKAFKIPQKSIRREAFGEIKDIINYPNFPQDLAEKSFEIEVHMGNIVKQIPALSTESVLVALERAKLAPPSKCRSGECGFCRSYLISGDIYVSPVSDWRRTADKKYNFFHPCASYPISNLKIEVPRNLF
ncbi:MAG: FAD-binding oxidoreductase, partial [Candidatus Hermodarchaeota archaeon]